MLTRLLYVSTSVGPVTTAVTGTILRSAQKHNSTSGITGVLCQGRGVYLQVLEGERSHVDALYGRIALDKRHQNLVLRQQEDIRRRRYGKWAMALIDMAHLDPREALHQPAAFDPYQATAEGIMAKIDALIAAGSVMEVPMA